MSVLGSRVLSPLLQVSNLVPHLGCVFTVLLDVVLILPGGGGDTGSEQGKVALWGALSPLWNLNSDRYSKE